MARLSARAEIAPDMPSGDAAMRRVAEHLRGNGHEVDN